jgi:hypothetical protein
MRDVGLKNLRQFATRLVKCSCGHGKLPFFLSFLPMLLDALSKATSDTGPWMPSTSVPYQEKKELWAQKLQNNGGLVKK